MSSVTDDDVLEELRMECGCLQDGRILAVCIDGTSNKFGTKNTNVIELYNLILKKAGSNQLTWYNSGIGTYARPSWASLKYWLQVLGHKIDLAIAWNFERTVMGAYRWLSDNYQEGDRIFLFGFSRGAFQVRVLSAMIDKVGLIYKGNEMQIPFAYELYADPESDKPTETAVGGSIQGGTSMAERFKKAFCQEGVKVHFVGAWDTVSSIGIARGQKLLPGTVDGMKHVCYFRHALALDERRVKFLPEYAHGDTTLGPNGQGDHGSPKHPRPISGDLELKRNSDADSTEREAGRKREQTKEVWFAGTHSDIGGGNVENPAMDRSRPPLRWMVLEAQMAGLRTSSFQGALSSKDLVEIKESLTGGWWPLEIIPFKRLTYSRTGAKKTTHKPHLGKSRKIHPGQKIHASLVLADPDKKYVPKAIPPPDHPHLFQEVDAGWVEEDAFDMLEVVIDEFIEDGKELKRLDKISSTGMSSSRQALFDKLEESLLSKKVALTRKYELLQYCLEILQRGADTDKQPMQLGSLVTLGPTLEDLIDLDSSCCIRDFIQDFTDRCAHVIDLGTRNDVNSVAFSPKANVLAATFGAQGLIQLWNTKTWQAEGPVFRGHTSWAKSPDGSRIASGSEDNTVHLWDAATGDAIGPPMEGHDAFVYSVAFSPDGRHVASGSRDIDNKITLWDVRTRQPVGEPLRGHTRAVTFVVFSPDGKYLASGSWDMTIRLWNLETGKQDGRPFEGHTYIVLSIAFSPDGKRIASGSADETVRLWNVETREEEGPPLRGHTSTVWSVVFSPDGKRVASGSSDGTIRIWDVEN